MRGSITDGHTSWDSMKLHKAIVLRDMEELRKRLYVGLSMKLTTTVHTRERMVRYTNWAVVTEVYPYHCLVEMYYDNGYSTIIIKRDILYCDLLVAIKNGTVPFVETTDRFIEREVSRV